MQVVAIHKNARMSPRKIRPIMNLIRGMHVQTAEDQLVSMSGKASGIVHAVLKSAMANATHNYDVEASKLRVAQAQVDEGIVMKRFQPVSRGMAHPILRRTAHVRIVLESSAQDAGKAKKGKKTEITTISADEYATSHVHEHKEEQEQELSKGEELVKDEPDRGVEQTKDTEEYKAFQKTKMNQQGGDKKKTHRRKSM